MFRDSLKRKVSDYLPALLLTLPVIANFFARNSAEYLFDVFILTTLYWTIAKSRGLTWNNFIVRSKFDFIWPALILVILLGYIVNQTLQEPQLREFLQFLWILGFYCYARVLKIARFPKGSLELFCLFIIILSIALITDFFINPPIKPSTWGLPNRLVGTFTNTNLLAHSYSLILLYLAALLFSHLSTASSKKIKILLGIAIFTFIPVLLFTFNRSIWITFICAIPLLAATWKRWAGIGMIATFVALGAVLYFSNLGGISNRINSTISQSSAGDVARINLWKTNYHIFKTHPVLGIGYYNNTRDIQKYYTELGVTSHTENTHAHNEILSFLAGTGIAGTSLFISLFCYFAWLAWKALPLIPKDYPVRRGVLLGSLILQPSFLINGLADNNFEIHAARNILVISWAIILYFSCEYRSKTGPFHC